MKVLKHIYIMLMSSLLLLGCEQNKVGLYEGPDEAYFLETSGSMIVDEGNPTVIIEIGTSTVQGTDRTYTVEVDNERSSAAEGTDFELVSHSVTIPANETVGTFEVRGLYDGVSPDGRTAVFRITASGEGIADYKNNYALGLFKFCSFEREAFVGNYTIYENSSVFGPYNYPVTTMPGEDEFSIYVDGLWTLAGTPVKVVFNSRASTCNIPEQAVFVHETYGQAYIKSIEDGTINSCKGSIEGLEYMVYVEAGYFDITSSYWEKDAMAPATFGKARIDFNALSPIPFGNE
ncbi:hypothetical protein [Carboxylicivirga sp. RSCT41]|uniref:hypothetical protein n=1 Tax=Carboxylicivirga agarovorans TaxID=3417570 RepID=UPI003D348E75